MSMVHSYAVGNGDMFSIRHNSDNFTIIDCSMSTDDRDWILAELKKQAQGKGISRFISTHPDQDHIMGLEYLDGEMPICNFYCVANNATKPDETDDFKHYRKLRDGEKAFNIYKGCSRKWMNIGDDERGQAGIQILWPDVDNTDYKAALQDATIGDCPNNISPVISYGVQDSGSFLWMGDLETDFMERIEYEVDWPDIDILFAPHHGRDSGKIPKSILSVMSPRIIVIGEAPSQHLDYYGSYNTITQNTAGTIAFECVGNCIHIYVSNENYLVNFLSNHGATTYKNYIGTLEV
jgi:beta-lactamase superfamily II metal-dependent hydrolase